MVHSGTKSIFRAEIVEPCLLDQTPNRMELWHCGIDNLLSQLTLIWGWSTYINHIWLYLCFLQTGALWEAAESHFWYGCTYIQYEDRH